MIPYSSHTMFETTGKPRASGDDPLIKQVQAYAGK